MIVAFDSNIIIWGMQIRGMKRGNPKQKDLSDLQRRSAILFDPYRNGPVAISAIALSEVLIGVLVENRDEFMDFAQKFFVCVPFDVRAVALASRLWGTHRKGNDGSPVNRVCLRADVQIVASLKMADVDLLYSHDQHLRNIAEAAGLKARDLPTHHENDMHFGEEK